MTPWVKPGILTIDEIIAQSFGVSIEWMTTRSRKRIGVEARQFAMWWRERNTKDSLAVIGNMYGGRDHATVLHAKKTVNNLMETNKVFRHKAEDAIKLLEQLKF